MWWVYEAGNAKSTAWCYKEDKHQQETKATPGAYFCTLDLQKVRMLPGISGLKSAVFTQRICAYNKSFCPIGTDCGKSRAVIWHQGNGERNDEDIVSSLIKFLKQLSPDVKHVLTWMDLWTTEQELDFVFRHTCHCEQQTVCSRQSHIQVFWSWTYFHECWFVSSSGGRCL